MRGQGPTESRVLAGLVSSRMKGWTLPLQPHSSELNLKPHSKTHTVLRNPQRHTPTLRSPRAPTTNG